MYLHRQYVSWIVINIDYKVGENINWYPTYSNVTQEHIVAESDIE